MFGIGKKKPTTPAAPITDLSTFQTKVVGGIRKTGQAITSTKAAAVKGGKLALDTTVSIAGYKDSSWTTWIIVFCSIMVISAQFIWQSVVIIKFIRTYPTSMPMIDLKVYNMMLMYLVLTSLFMGLTYATLIRSNPDSLLIVIVLAWIAYNMTFSIKFWLLYASTDTHEDIWPMLSESSASSSVSSTSNFISSSSSPPVSNILNTSFTPFPSSNSPFRTSSAPPSSSASPSSSAPSPSNSPTTCSIPKNFAEALAVRNASIFTVVTNSCIIGFVALYFMGRSTYFYYKGKKAAEVEAARLKTVADATATAAITATTTV